MNYRTLGRTGLKVSEIGLGSEAFVNQSLEFGVELVDTDLDSGINDCYLSNTEP